jgi:PAS domain S-box-containing protein
MLAEPAGAQERSSAMGQSSPAQTDVLPDVAAVRAELERERKVTSSLLRLIASDLDLQALMQEVTLLLRDWTGCEAVGIRLAQKEDFPYFETRGFPPEFVAVETFLCDRDGEGHARRDADGTPLLECTCGNVLRGRLDLAHPNTTPGGSYWTNSTSRPRVDRVGPDTRHNPRNRCSDSGYESVALIPLRSGDTTYGLVQLNDTQPNRFTQDQILRLEELARALAEAVARRAAIDESSRMQQRLQENEDLLVIERDLAATLGCARTVAEVLEPSLRAAIAATRMEAGGLYLLDEADNHLRLACHFGVSDAFAQAAREFDMESIQAHLGVFNGLAEFTTDGVPRPEFEIARSEGFQSIVVLPVSHEGYSIATLNLASRQQFQLSTQARHTVTVIASLLGATLARLRADEALRQSQRELRAVYDHSPIMMCVLDAERRLLYMNHAMSAFFGREEAELRLQTAGQLLHCAGALQDPGGCGYGQSCQTCALRLAIDHTLITGVTYQNIERRISVERDGLASEVTILASTALLATPTGPNLLVCLQDISDRKAAETQLRQQAMVLDQIADCVTITDLEGRITYVNDAECRLFQRTRDEMIGWNVTHYGDDPATGASQHEIIERTIQDGAWRGEVTNLLPDGQRRVFDCRTRLLARNAGPPTALVGISTDITEQKKAEEALRDREARYRAVVETSVDGFWVADLDGNILEANATYARLSGYSQAELVSMHIADLEAVESRETVVARIAQIIKNGSDLFETQHRAKDGTVWQVQISVTHWPFAGGRILVFLRDFRRRSRSEALLRTRLKLSELAQAGNLNQLMQEAVDETELYTGSRIGFFHFVDEDQEHITLQAWSTNTQKRFCHAEGHGLHYHISEAGVWADCMRRREPVIHNAYASLPHRKVLPNGHAEVVRELVVPVIQGDRVVAILGVGNKSTDYIAEDLEVVQAVASMAMDIVARKRAEEANSLAQERLELAQQSAGAGLWEWDLANDRLNWSPQLFRLFGLDPARDEANMERFFGLVHADDLVSTLERKDSLPRSTEPFHSEYRIGLPDGGARWIEAMGSTHFAEDGTPLSMSGICLDITQRKKSEEQLRLSEERFRRLFETMEEGCYLADAVFDAAGNCLDWRFLNVNTAYERLIGRTRDELVGRRMSAVFPHLDSGWRDAHIKVIGSGQPVRCEGSFLTASGYFVAHLFSPDCGQVAAIISDNTHRKADENRLAELQLQLHHTSRLATMGELAAGIAHDVNQPLCSIANFANACRNLASSERADLQQIREWSEAIVTAAARAGDIIRRLLGYARRNQPDRRPSTMEQLLADALLLVQHEARANRVSIRLENEDPHLAIEVQTVPIQQVMVNLLRNSIDALQNSEKPERHVHVHAAHSDGRLQVAVADNGTGLPADVATRVFDPFFTTKTHGLGLGLAISRTIVEDHGGIIWATNNDEGGLTVHFTLPTK